MTAENYRAALTAAIKEYEALGEQRRDIDKRLAQLAHTIGTLSKLLGLTPTVPMGLTDAIRLVVRGAGLPMTPVDVRDRLHAIGFDVSKYSNDLAAVHTILKRLNESGELRFIPRAPGKHQYTWNRPTTPVALGPDIVAFMRDHQIELDAIQPGPRPRPHRGPQRGSRAGVARGAEDVEIRGDVSAKGRGDEAGSPTRAPRAAAARGTRTRQPRGGAHGAPPPAKKSKRRARK